VLDFCGSSDLLNIFFVIDLLQTLSKSPYQSAPVHALFVYESVELELSLTTIAIETDELLNDYFSCPIRLVRGSIDCIFYIFANC